MNFSSSRVKIANNADGIYEPLNFQKLPQSSLARHPVEPHLSTAIHTVFAKKGGSLVRLQSRHSKGINEGVDEEIKKSGGGVVVEIKGGGNGGAG